MMHLARFHLILLYCFLFYSSVQAQTINPSILNKPWNAYWIAVPGEPANDYGVYHFRKSFELALQPSSFIVHVSADNRYKLYVNENLVSLGPARGDMYYWNFETVDLAPFLVQGKNIVAAVVWNDGNYRPEAQISFRTGFIVQGNTETEEVLNTDTGWRCIRNSAYHPLTGIGYSTYYVAGPGEQINMNEFVKGWSLNDYNDSAWQKANRTWTVGKPKGMRDAFGWMLVPSSLPQMELKQQRLALVRKVEGMAVPASFPETKTNVTIPANTTATLLLDQAYLTNAYLTLIFSNGKGAGISLSYAEALFSAETIPGKSPRLSKGNRNEVEGKHFAGRKDSIISDGTQHQTFTTLAWRTYRYIQLRVETNNEPLIIEDIYGTFTGYPFQLNAKLETENPELQKFFETGWHTARLCAVETYMDCPYYEQLQYIGDTRIQALVSYYNSGDDRLVRNALNQMDHSRIAEGLTLSRHPSFSPQIISTFSLWYISMLHDFWMYRNDSSFVKEKLQGARNVLWFFSKFQQPDGSLKNVPYWLFTDWVENRKGWEAGEAPVGTNGNSSVLDFQLLWALQLAAEMESKLGVKEYAITYQKMAARLQNTIQTKYWDNAKRMYADTDDKALFSQHANALAILTKTISGKAANTLATKILSDTSLAPASIYFKFYLHQALVKAGLGNDYINWLDKWRENLRMGLTTWAEISEIDFARSDCHAWGASPNIEFFRVTLGIDSDAPAFKKIKVEPHLGDLKKISGSIPHPNGTVSASYSFEKGKWNILIELPNKTTGTLLWKEKQYALKAGSNKFSL